MKKISTILRLIDDLESELFLRFSNEEIVKAVENEEKKKAFAGNCISVIYNGSADEIEAERIMEEDKNIRDIYGFYKE